MNHHPAHGNLILAEFTERALDLLRQFEPPEGYYLAFSGGKDSSVLLDLATRAGVAFEPHYHDTGIDPPELRAFVRALGIPWDRPPVSFFALIPLNGWPSRRSRWCCKYLKHQHGNGRVVLTGIRAAESWSRATQRRLVETCTRTSTSTLHPILDWPTTLVWDYITENRLEVCSLYHEGRARIGCLFCPCSPSAQRVQDATRYPKMVRAFEHAFDKLIARRRATLGPTWFPQFGSGRELFAWWIRDGQDPDPEPELDE